MHGVNMFTALFAQAPASAAMKSSALAHWFSTLPGWVSVPIVIALVFVLPFVVGVALAKQVRMNGYGWKFGLIISTLVASLLTILLGWPPRLGVDLKGGYIMIWKIDAERQAERQQAPGQMRRMAGEGQSDIAALIEALKRRLNPDGLKEISIRPYGTSEVEIIIPETDPVEIAKIKRQILSQGFLEFLILAESGTDRDLFDTAKKRASDMATRRLRQIKNESGDVIGKWVRVGTDEEKRGGIRPLRIKGGWTSFLVRNAATGELIEGATIPPDEVAAARYLEKEKISAVEVLTKVTASQMVTGADLSTGGVGMGRDQNGFPEVEFAFRGEGAQRMGALTSNNISRQLAIILDDTLLSAANIKSQITDSGRITGRFTEEEVNFVVRILKAGSLPATLQSTPVYEDPSDPTLGAENIQQGFLAIWVSLAVVFLFVLWYYQFAGFVACFALAMNILMTLAVMILFSATLTLPGLAGMVLTVGMAVDSSVLIFERLREELAKGASLRMAIRNGFDRAMATIIDSNLTTLLTAVILYVIGTDQLVGFAVTLILGIITSMFTAIFCSRVMLEVAERTGFVKTLNVRSLFALTNFDFVGYQGGFIAASIIIIAIGLVATFIRGGGILDIDLRGGSSVQVALKEPMSDADVRKLLDEAFADKTFEGSRVDYSLKPVKQADEQGRRNTYRVESIYPDTAEVQSWIEKAFVVNNESLLKRYSLDFEVKNAPSSKAGAMTTRDESLFFTSLKQDAVPEAKAEEKAATPSAEAKTAAPVEKTEAEKKVDTEMKEPVAVEKTATEKAAQDAPKTDAGEKAAVVPANVPDQPQPTESAAAKTKVTVRLSDNSGQAEGIDASALRTRILEAAKALDIETLQNAVVIDHPQWDGEPESRLTEWNVELPTSANDTQRIFQRLQQDLQSTPIWAASKKIGGQIAGDFVRIAIFSVLISLVGIIAYIWVRFQNIQWGFAAVLALVHDVLCMLAGIAVSYWLRDVLAFAGMMEFKIDLTVIAAFLTLIGYSINDTIVIFDRMREVKGKSPRLTRQIVNDSVNQTLSRTFLTFFTTFMVVVVLYAVGGSGIHGFAFAMLIGTVVGCYSSIFIAAPFLLWMLEAEEKAMHKSN